MHRRRITRRHALGLGAAAVAGGLLRPPRLALAAPAALFELPLGADGRVTAAGWRTSGVLRAPRRFDLVGLRWDGGGHLDAEVRARRAGGSWSSWLPLAAAADHGPDGAAPVSGTEPAYTGAADLVQLRLRGSARGARLRFVRAQPAARAARRLSQRRQVPTGPPLIITRAEWGAAAVPPRNTPSYGTVQLAFVHHTVSTNTYLPHESAGIVLGIARYHRDSNGWNDLGYNFLVDRYGQVFEGRAGGVDAPVVGAQAQGFNAVSTGIACLGDFGIAGQAEAALDVLARLVAWKLSLHGVPVTGPVVVTSAGGATTRYPRGTAVTFERISGHRDGNHTACPGDALYAQLPALRTRAATYAAPLSTLTLRAASPRVRHPSPAALAGQLRFSDGASPAGAPVQVELEGAGGAWLPVAQAAAAPDGAWSATVALPRGGPVRAVFAGDAVHPALTSSTVAIAVLPRLSLSVSPRRARAGASFGVAGTCSPRPADGRVQLVLERQVGRRWILVQRKKVRVTAGRYATRVKLRRRGRHRLWITADGAAESRLLRAL